MPRRNQGGQWGQEMLDRCVKVSNCLYVSYLYVLRMCVLYLCVSTSIYALYVFIFVCFMSVSFNICVFEYQCMHLVLHSVTRPLTHPLTHYITHISSNTRYEGVIEDVSVDRGEKTNTGRNIEDVRRRGGRWRRRRCWWRWWRE